MKNKLISILCFLTAYSLNAQIQKDHSMTVSIDGKEFKTQPQQIRIGAYRYITGNAIKPDQSLRIWIGGWDGGVVTASGSYLIVNGDKPDTKDNFKKAEDLGKYKGIAAIKYVLETKAPLGTINWNILIIRIGWFNPRRQKQPCTNLKMEKNLFFPMDWSSEVFV